MPAAPPPSADPLVALADRCVQCGLCLPACPTYGLDRLEAESPRGRIALARAWALDTVEVTEAGETHLDQCLGCRSCEAVCPAGVQYGQLLVAARERQQGRRTDSWRARAIRHLVTRTRLLSFGLALYRQWYDWLPPGWRPLPRPADRRFPAPATQSGKRTQVSVFVGCVAEAYETGLRAALARLCDAIGFQVIETPGQSCCGSLHAHAGDVARAQQLASRNRAAFAGARTVLTLASGCHESVAQALDTRTVDAIAFLAQHAASLPLRRCDERIALHLPCTQRNVVRSVPALRQLLAQVPGLSVIELDAGYGCCGAAGVQMLEDPARAARFREPLLQQLIQSKATRLLSANIGCRLHLAQGTSVPVQHPLEFLAGLLEPSPANRDPNI
ncbi:(Fe-S)-binding protein [Lysobacter niastensis]|uniref:Glycolate oxidase iron-sulfur subunit n=1 Tax=Lysobacter niastensis TaxID=380629 RepID=A0ABS0BAQ2_9GAMM|nr:(Fe-S)-binding protein [Lysobacter niastensis]MBF6024937.1 (Fe-S)-binding protein [Lysobacter niastensis]